MQPSQLCLLVCPSDSMAIDWRWFAAVPRFAFEPLLRRRCARCNAVNGDVPALELFAENPRENFYGTFCRAVNRVSRMCIEYARRRQIDDSSTTTHALGCLTKTEKCPPRIDRKCPVVSLVCRIGDWHGTDGDVGPTPSSKLVFDAVAHKLPPMVPPGGSAVVDARDVAAGMLFRPT
jgi:hypothetical protein